MFKSAATLGLVALAAAAPAEKRQVGVTAYNANFDDLGVSPAALAPIGVYDGLNYMGIDLLTTGVLGAAPPPTGVTAHSPPNTGGYGTTATIPTQGQPMIVTTGTKTKFFDFNSFYFGCPLQTDESITGLPIPCTLTVTGYRFGVKIASQSFKFSPPTGATSASMVKATLSGAFNNIDKAMFSTNYGANQALGATLLDNLNYITFSS